MQSWEGELLPCAIIPRIAGRTGLQLSAQPLCNLRTARGLDKGKFCEKNGCQKPCAQSYFGAFTCAKFDGHVGDKT